MTGEADQFTVTTANTHYNQAIATPETTQDFAGTDILLLQEVLKIDQGQVEANLGRIGLKIAAIDEEAGLAVAVSDKFRVAGSESYEVQPRSKIANRAEAMGFNPRLRKRSLLVAHLTDNDGNKIAAATGHPIVFVRYRSRIRQVKTTSQVLTREYPEGLLIYGSDGNHYPGPRKVDRNLATASNLKQVGVTDPTVILSETKHNYLRRIGIKDAQLDALMTRGFTEIRSHLLKINSDHRAMQAVLSIAKHK